jgi:hypothetical protein
MLEIIKNNRIPLGDKPDLIKTGRIAEAKKLTKLFSEHKQFSYIRIGDGDLGLIHDPSGSEKIKNTYENIISGTEARGFPGLNANQVDRLLNAIEKANYLDYCECLWKDDSLIKKTELNRSKNLYNNSSRESSYILPTWLEIEFKSYCKEKRILFCGAEAPLLSELFKSSEFKNISQQYFYENSNIFFLRPVDNGKNLAENLDKIKNEIIYEIKKNKIDVLFLSLGGGAKILCAEIAEELAINTIDFGACMRSLTYSGSDGNLSSRSSHSIYLYRVPFDLYMNSLIVAYPELTNEELFAKAHAQLILEVQKKEVGWSHGAWTYDFSKENILNFRESIKIYYKKYKKYKNTDRNTLKEYNKFLHFCGTYNLTFFGKLFLLKFKIKCLLKNIFQSVLL